jgi:hypothetical protein
VHEAARAVAASPEVDRAARIGLIHDIGRLRSLESDLAPPLDAHPAFAATLAAQGCDRGIELESSVT